jgi:hypothetical protein
VRSCSLAARGLWTDMLCLMFESPRRGYLQQANGTPLSSSQIARMTGCDTDEAAHLLQELEDAGVFSRTEHGVIYSRRIARDERQREVNRENGKRGGNPKLTNSVKRNSNPPVNRKINRNLTPSSSSSSSSSTSVLNTEDSSAVAKPTTKPPSVENPVLEFPCVGQQKIWGLTESQVSAWSELYPGLDVLGECRKALAWVQANERKTASGMPKFLVRWLNKASDGSRSRSGSVEGKQFLTTAQQREENMRKVGERIAEAERTGKPFLAIGGSK